MKFAITSALLVLSTPVAAQNAGMVTATEIDPAAYTGTWFEVARTPAPFQQKCEAGVTANYELIDETTMKVINRCDLPDGQTQSITGQAQVRDGNFNTFAVELGDSDSPGINYVVAAASDVIDEKYQWAAVYSPESDIGWILTRSPDLDAAAREQAEAALEKAEIDISQLDDTPQPPKTYARSLQQRKDVRFMAGSSNLGTILKAEKLTRTIAIDLVDECPIKNPRAEILHVERHSIF